MDDPNRHLESLPTPDFQPQPSPEPHALEPSRFLVFSVLAVVITGVIAGSVYIVQTNRNDVRNFAREPIVPAGSIPGCQTDADCAPEERCLYETCLEDVGMPENYVAEEDMSMPENYVSEPDDPAPATEDLFIIPAGGY